MESRGKVGLLRRANFGSIRHTKGCLGLQGKLVCKVGVR